MTKKLQATRKSNMNAPETSPETMMTNLQLVIDIVKTTRGTESIESIHEASASIFELAKRLGVDFNEAFIISAMMEWDLSMTVAGIRNFFDCSRLEAQLFESVFEDLAKKGIVAKEGYDEDDFIYRLNPAMAQAIRDNKPYVKEKKRKLSTEDFWAAVGKIYLHDQFHIFSAIYELDTLLSWNKTSGLAKLFATHSLHDREKLLLAWALWRRYSALEDALDLEMLSRYDNCLHLKGAFMAVFKGKLALVKGKLMETVCDDGLVSKNAIRLTDTCVREVLGASLVQPKQDVYIDGLIRHKNIPTQELYYNADENEMVQKIVRSIEEKNFQQIQMRMKEASFRTSLAILLYGAPGVGKTALCFKLAQLSGRDIIEVKVSDLRDKYVGEAEKHAQEIFDRYRKILKSSEKAPILLLNEADSMLTKRSQNNDSPAAKGENAMQNIFLREFEKFEGILMATTNLQGNFDPAFERRFLIKLRLSQPGADTRAKIWKSQVKGLSQEAAARLGEEFVMSGGQIENCARRQMIDWLLDGKVATYESLASLAREELGFKKSDRKAVGFKVA